MHRDGTFFRLMLFGLNFDTLSEAQLCQVCADLDDRPVGHVQVVGGGPDHLPFGVP